MTSFRTYVSDKNSLCGFYISDFSDLRVFFFFFNILEA